MQLRPTAILRVPLLLGALTLASVLSSACSHESDEVDTGADAVTSTTAPGVRVGSIQLGTSRPGRFRLGSNVAADDAANAVFFAHASALAYRDGLEPNAAAPPGEPTLLELVAELGFEQYFFFDATFSDESIDADRVTRSDKRGSAPDAQGYVALVTPRDAPGEKAVIIGYRGTDTLRDALTDAWVSKIDAEEYGVGEGIEVHAGFRAQTQILWDAIEAKVWKLFVKPASMRKNADDVFWPVFFTGHSLGGAVAVVAASRVVSPKSDEEIAHLRTRYGAPAPERGRGYPIGGIFTFGQPRVGNRAFVDSLRSRLESTRQFRPDGIPYVRYYNGRDIVGRVPRIGYAHGGLEIRIGGEATECAAWDDSFRLGYTVSDHTMKSYVDAVDDAVSRATAKGADRLCGQ